MPVRGWAAAPLLCLLLASGCGSAGRGPTVRIGEEAELSLARACVKAGEEQTLKVRAPHSAVAIFGTTYADGKGGGPAPYGAGYGGNASEIVPESGVAEMRWKIAPDAPPGPVAVEVSMLLGTEEGDREDRELTFTVVGRDDSCP